MDASGFCRYISTAYSPFHSLLIYDSYCRFFFFSALAPARASLSYIFSLLSNDLLSLYLHSTLTFLAPFIAHYIYRFHWATNLLKTSSYLNLPGLNFFSLFVGLCTILLCILHVLEAGFDLPGLMSVFNETGIQKNTRYRVVGGSMVRVEIHPYLNARNISRYKLNEFIAIGDVCRLF